MDARQFVGIDEAGRGPLAGPVAVSAVSVSRDFSVLDEFPGVKDSKVMSAKSREKIFEAAMMRKNEGSISFSVSFADAASIDEHGITCAVSGALGSALAALELVPEETHVFLDGLLKAPPAYSQETIIRGDALIPLISLASVIAKVSRDRLMEDLAKQYPEYHLDVHKGYGTKAHMAAIREFGPSPIHRKSFLTRVLAAV